jgi:exopolysaccharide biosynthesis polyprenyl glycosylphosphotransferase
VTFVDFIPIIELIVIDIVIMTGFSYIANKIFSSLYPPKRIIVLYTDYDPTEFLHKIKKRGDKYNIEKAIKVTSKDNINTVMEEAADCEGILIYDMHSELRNAILKYCYKNNKRTYITPKISDILIRSGTEINLFDSPLLLCHNAGLTTEQRIIKRGVDIIVSSVLIVLSAPLMLIAAILIKGYDEGPVFFTQKRHTINSEVFDIHKFRSMIVDAEKDGISIPATDKDPRITPVGSFLRKTRIDELPQLFDIFIGKMSMVGPRPERIEHGEEYKGIVPEFDFRLKVKGGLTGYAQIYGKYNTTPYDKLKLDLMYIQNYSFLLDIKLILLTIKVVFMKDSTEGFVKK